MKTERTATLIEKLKKVFGYNQFRGNQEAIIKNVLTGKNTFVIMPTGGGKSLCYQIPALVQEGTAIVISPLIALMKNQVDQLNSLAVKAAFLNSTLSRKESTKVKKEVAVGKIKLLYIAPETLIKGDSLAFLKQANICFLAVDEAHCISEWGHDFRPEYRKIRKIIDHLGKLPIIGLTATATPKVQLDILKNLAIEDATIFNASFNRENLYYEVRPKKQIRKQLIKFIKSHKGKSGIVYCQSRKKVKEVADFLHVNDIKAAPYHAGLDTAVRMKNQDAFLNEDIDVIVATIAFGMGIDKPDVRFVIHYDVPKSLEGYYQETGRAGRDGLEGICLMFYSYADILKLEKFNKDKATTERENNKILLQEMAAYAESSVCRRKQLLHYFGEPYKDNCGHCDNCIHPQEKYEGKDFLQTALTVIQQTEERFDVNHAIHLIRGIESTYIKSYQHQKLAIFGKGKDKDDTFWKSVIRQALLHNFLKKDIENIGILKITQQGKDFLAQPYSVTLSKDHEYENIDEDTTNKDAVIKGYDENLFNLLKGLRKKIAQEKKIPPYVVFQDPSLEEMATIYPTAMEDLSRISGVGIGKATKFGKPFIELINKYVEENNITTVSEIVIKSTANKAKHKVQIIHQIDKKVDLEEIAASNSMSMEELIEEIEQICYAGTKLNLDYYIDKILSEDKQAEIYGYFMHTEADSLEEAYEELGEEFYEEDIRLMRIKFLSEVAN
ncbi:MAG: DNA helicase RecQ [Cytophagales bacterium]|nr:DNA helicase RecQ [Cytophagales bacterium]